MRSKAVRQRIGELDSDAGVADMLDDFHEAHFQGRRRSHREARRPTEGDERAPRRSVDLQRATTEPPGGPETYKGRRGSRREVRRPTAGDDGDAGRSVDLKRVTRETLGGL
jgi:hypothetical protein